MFITTEHQQNWHKLASDRNSHFTATHFVDDQNTCLLVCRVHRAIFTSIVGLPAYSKHTYM